MKKYIIIILKVIRENCERTCGKFFRKFCRNLQRMIYKFPQQIHILSGKIKKKMNHTGEYNGVFYINNPSFKPTRQSRHLYGPSAQRRIDIDLRKEVSRRKNMAVTSARHKSSDLTHRWKCLCTH